MLPLQVLADARILCTKATICKRDIDLAHLQKSQLHAIFLSLKKTCDCSVFFRVIRYFDKEPTWNSFRTSDDDMVFVLCAMIEKRMCLLRLMLEKQFFTIYDMDRDIETMRHALSWNMNINIHKLFIKHGLSKHHTWSNLVLQMAFFRGDLKYVKYLIRSGLSVRSHNFRGDDALMPAFRFGYLQLAKCVIRKERLDKYYLSMRCPQLLLAATENGHLELIQLLIRKAQLTNTDLEANNNILFREAKKHNHDHIVQFLIQRGITVRACRSEHNGNMLCGAHSYEYLPAIQTIFQHNLDLNDTYFRFVDTTHRQIMQYFTQHSLNNARSTIYPTNHHSHISINRGCVKHLTSIIEQLGLQTEKLRLNSNYFLFAVSRRRHFGSVQFLIHQGWTAARNVADYQRILRLDRQFRIYKFYNQPIRKRKQPVVY